MTTRIRYALLLPSLLTLLCVTAAKAQAPYNLDYSEDNPVIIVCDWDFPPYEFSNNNGEPDGYNIELLQTIFNKLDIPCKFLLKEWNDATHAFERREADLIIDPSYHYHVRPYIRSANILNYYKVKLVLGQHARHITQLADFTESDTLILKENDYAANRIVEERQLQIPIEYHSPKDALAGINDGRYNYFIWGEGPLMWKKKELAIDSLTTVDIDIPDGEIRIVGYDKELIDFVDDEMARMEQSGELQQMHDKWFHPERIHDNTSPIALFVLAGAVIAVIIALMLSRLVKSRVQVAVNRSADLNNMMQQALKMGHYYVANLDLKTHLCTNVHGDLLPEKGLKQEHLLDNIHPDDREPLVASVRSLINGEKQQATYTWRLNRGTPTQPDWHWVQGTYAMEATGHSKKPTNVVNTMKDITQQMNEERINSELSSKYMKIFETNIVAMSFYDKDGYLLDLNENMRLITGTDKNGRSTLQDQSLFEVPLMKGQYEKGSRDFFHSCQHTYYPDKGIDCYLEIHISPVIDSQGELQYYVVTSRDITEERRIYLEQHRHNKEMQKTNDAINQYESQLQYLLEKSDMFVWKFDLVTRQIHFSRSLRQPGYAMSRDEYIQNLYEDEREEADEKLIGMIQRGEDFNAIHHFTWLPVNPQPCWYVLSGVPERLPNGKITHYYGVARDVTTLMEAQQKLKQETSRAEDSGRMKSAFLANMTHEIRTPLNAIVGFSDLLPVIDTQEERMEFIRIIRNNCDMLMRLINDILEASSMGQALAIKPEKVDFALVFDDICQTLAQRVQEPGVEFIKDNPYGHCVTVLDKGRVQQVLTNFVTNAVKYTHEGYIKVGYHWDRRLTHDGSSTTDGLVFYCLDTGAGIPKEKQASVFERFVKLNDFVQGTGLGLSICQNIAERCNGHIGVTSEGEGHGSTFWLWMPCPKGMDN